MLLCDWLDSACSVTFCRACLLVPPLAMVVYVAMVWLHRLNN